MTNTQMMAFMILGVAFFGLGLSIFASLSYVETQLHIICLQETMNATTDAWRNICK